MMRKRSLYVLAALWFATLQPAMAQQTGPHGGLLAGKAGHQTELVVTATELAVYIIDHGKVHDAKGVRLRAVIQQDGKTTSVDFAVEGSRLLAKLAAPLGAGAVVVLTGRDEHGDVISSRYVLK